MNRPAVHVPLEGLPRRGGGRRALLLASLAANVVLGGLILGRLAAHRETSPAAPAEAGPVRPAWAVRPPPAPAAEAPPPGVMRLDVHEPFTWASLPSSDLAALRDALRARECPERLVRVVLRGILKRELDARVEALLRPVLDDFWGWLDLDDPEKVEALGNAIEAVQDEIQERYAALIEGVPEPPETAVKPPDSRYAFLPEEKQAALKELQRQFVERRRALHREFAGQTEKHRAAERQLEAEQEAARDALLTEEEREEFRLRSSRRANQLRQLQEIGLEPAELRDIAATRDAFAARRETEGQALQDQARNEFMEKLRTEEEAALRQRLGDARYAELRRAEDGDYQETMAIVRRLGLPEATGRALWELATSLRAGYRDSPDSRATTVADLAARAEREVARLLGGDRHAIATYRRHQLQWLTRTQAELSKDPFDRDW